MTDPHSNLVRQIVRLADDVHRLLPDIDITRVQRAQILRYVTALRDYNRIHRVTGTRTAEDMLRLHVADSIGLLPWMTPPLVDVGSGAGLPGILLKILQPDWEVTLVEPRKKASAFIAWMIAELGLRNVRLLDRRAEAVRIGDLLNPDGASTLVAKGFGDTRRLREVAGHLLAPSFLEGDSAPPLSVVVPSGNPEPVHSGEEVHPHPLMGDRFLHVIRIPPENRF